MKKRPPSRYKSIYTRASMLILALLLLAGSLFSIQMASASILSHLARIGGCTVFPSDNVWNADISHLPVSTRSSSYVASIGLGSHLHPDFGAGLYAGGPIGFSYTVVPASQPSVPMHFTYASDSDPGPYPIPANAPIEGGANSSGDRHVLVVDQGNCKLYELYAAYRQSNGSWKAGSGAVWSLNSNALRPATWTSADAAGLPILPGLVMYDEVASGAITHALRFTVNRTQGTFIWPARHAASSSQNPALPPMGLRLRLKASVNISAFSHTNRIILTALKRYGMFVADNGSSWYLSGSADNRWNNDDLHALNSLPGSDFEAVNETSLQKSANSGQVATPHPAQASPTPKHTATATATGTEAPREATIPETKFKNISPSSSVRNQQSNGNQTLLIVGATSLLLLSLAGTTFLFMRKKRPKRTM